MNFKHLTHFTQHSKTLIKDLNKQHTPQCAY